MEKVSSRTERQLEIVQTFADNKGKGTLLAATGFGKTFKFKIKLAYNFEFTHERSGF